MLEIKSKDNQKLKFARRVGKGKERDHVFIEGLRVSKEVLRSRINPTEAFFSKSFVETNRELVEKIAARVPNASVLSDKIFYSISETQTPQGIVLICSKPETGSELIAVRIGKKEAGHPLVLMLHKVNNPNNLGAVFRTAEATGADGIIVTKNSASPFSSKAIRGSMGSNLRLPVWENAGFEDALLWAKQSNLAPICADGKGKTNYRVANWKTGRLLVFGSEAHGLSDEEFAQFDESVFIPMENRVESLNIAVSCGVVLYEIRRQNAS